MIKGSKEDNGENKDHKEPINFCVRDSSLKLAEKEEENDTLTKNHKPENMKLEDFDSLSAKDGGFSGEKSEGRVLKAVNKALEAKKGPKEADLRRFKRKMLKEVARAQKELERAKKRSERALRAENRDMVAKRVREEVKREVWSHGS